MRRVLGGIYSGYVFANDAVFMGFTYSQDDLWRRNHDTISGLELHAVDFNHITRHLLPTLLFLGQRWRHFSLREAFYQSRRAGAISSTLAS